MNKGLIALALGTLTLGIAEFVVMAILSNVAQSLDVSVSFAGYLISAYAIGVCVGAPALLVFRKVPLKKLLLCLLVVVFIGNFCSCVAPNYWMLMLSRFIAGLPHGAYFGVSAIVAMRLVKAGKGAQSVAIVGSGMAVANLFGVPLGPILCELASWRMVFVLVSVCSLIAIFAIAKWVPHIESRTHVRFRDQFFAFASLAPWLIIGATLVGSGGVFCWLSYVNPLLLTVSGFDPSDLTWLMMLAGGGMVIGTLSGGWLADKFKPGLVTCCIQFTMVFMLLAMFFCASSPWLVAILTFMCAAGLFAAASPLQYLIIKYSKHGEMLGGVSIQIAFNTGNALAAYLGGMALAMGFNASYPALIGAPLALLGSALLFILYRKYERVAN